MDGKQPAPNSMSRESMLQDRSNHGLELHCVRRCQAVIASESVPLRLAVIDQPRQSADRAAGLGVVAVRGRSDKNADHFIPPLPWFGGPPSGTPIGHG